MNKWRNLSMFSGLFFIGILVFELLTSFAYEQYLIFFFPPALIAFFATTLLSMQEQERENLESVAEFEARYKSLQLQEIEK